MSNFNTKPLTSRLAVAASAAVLLASAALEPVFAATDGALGATSTGSVNVSVKKTQLAKISGLTDLTLSSWQEGQGDVNLSEQFCVYSTRPNGGYTVKASGSGAGNAFALNDGADNLSLAYNLLWDAGGVGGLGSASTALTANTTSNRFTNAATDSSSCNGAHPGATAALTVNIPSASMVAASDGAYTGTLTLLVTPN